MIPTFATGLLLSVGKKAIMRLLQEQPEFSTLFVSFLLARSIRYEEDLVDQLFNSGELPLDAPDVPVLAEGVVFVAPLPLGQIHCGVRILDEGIRIVSVLGVDTDPNARAQMDL